jgi:uncharacterized SAM-binding protein YcdF (DUF218 family)
MQRPPPDASSDGIIVIFGAGVRHGGRPSATLRHRVVAAIALGNRLTHPRFIPTGAEGRHGPAEAVVMATLLRDAGFSDAQIIREETGTDTLSSVLAVRAILRTLPPGPVYACSSAYHLPRCRLLLRLAGINAQRCPPHPAPAASNPVKRWYWRLREVPALPYDAALMLWHRARHDRR